MNDELKQKILEQLSLDPNATNDPVEAARRQQVMEDSMNNAMGMMGGLKFIPEAEASLNAAQALAKAKKAGDTVAVVNKLGERAVGPNRFGKILHFGK